MTSQYKTYHNKYLDQFASLFLDEMRLCTQFSPTIYDESFYNHWVNATADGGFLSKGITNPVVSTSVLTSVIIDMFIIIN